MGPPPNNCFQPIKLSMLRGKRARVPFRWVAACALNPPEGVGFLDYARTLLCEAGLHGPDELREHLPLPNTPLLCREIAPERSPTPLHTPLLQAALLGLCNYGFYSPRRPFLWTDSRLARRVELFSVESFYED